MTATTTPPATSEAVARPSPRRRGPVARTLLAAVLVLMALEVSAQIVAPYIPPPGNWGTRDLDRAATLAARAAPGPVDVLLIGSSTVKVGFDDAAYSSALGEATVVNAGFDAAAPSSFGLFAEEYLLDTVDPATVVIGLNSRDFNDNGLNQADVLQRYLDSTGRLDHRGELPLTRRVDRRLSSWSAFVEHRETLRQPREVLDLIDKVRAGPPPPRDGYAVTDAFASGQRSLVLLDFTIGGEETAALTRLVGEIRRRGAHVVLVDMPIIADDYGALHPNGVGDIADYRQALADVARDLGVPVLWANDLGWDRSDFRDPIHLTQAGSERLSTWVAAEVDRLAG
jgi:hypothetical protein